MLQELKEYVENLTEEEKTILLTFQLKFFLELIHFLPQLPEFQAYPLMYKKRSRHLQSTIAELLTFLNKPVNTKNNAKMKY